MATVLYYLEKRNKNEKVLKEADELKKKTSNILKEISDLGYDSDTVSEIRDILHRQHGHTSFLEKTNEDSVTILVEHQTDWKPVFNLTGEYSNLVDMEKWYRKKENNFQIVCQKGRKKEVLTWEEFIESVSSIKWTKFGMPQKYNKEEETIWNYIYRSIYSKI